MRVEELHEFNPMLGHRGCRLGITYPEITEMQVAGDLRGRPQLQARGVDVQPEIMIPLVGHGREFKLRPRSCARTAAEVSPSAGDAALHASAR